MFQNFPLLHSDRGRPSNTSIFNNGCDIAFVNRQELIIIESKPLEQPENVQFLIGFLGDLINILIPLQIILKPYSKNLSFSYKAQRDSRNAQLGMRWGVSFEAYMYLEGLTLGGVQAEFVISPLVKFIKNHLHTTWLGKRAIFCKCQVIHILPALYLITQILSRIINDNLETNGAEFSALRKSSSEIA